MKFLIVFNILMFIIIIAWAIILEDSDKQDAGGECLMGDGRWHQCREHGK